MTASLARRTSDGLLVFAFDVTLIDISRFTTDIEVNGRGRAFVLAEDGRIVGLARGPQFPDDESLKSALLKQPGELGTPIARDLAAALGAGGGTGSPVRFVSEGDPWWGQLRRFALGSDRALLMGVAVPETDLLAGVVEQRIGIAVIAALVLLVSVGRAVVLAGRYSRPVEALVAESERISTGDLEPGEPIDTDVAEVRQLAQAHDTMREGLRTLLKIEHDLKIARRIQEGTFPERLPVLDGFDIAAWNEPADETGGDTYDVIGIKGASIGDAIILSDEEAGRAVLLLADATGHGIGPALSATQVRAMLRIAVRMSSDLSKIATHINQQLCADLPSGRFVTCWLGQLDPVEGTLTAVSGGQAPLLLYKSEPDEFEVRTADAPPMGLFDLGPIDVPPATHLAPGDIYAVLSDGIFEATDPQEVEFGEERVQQVIREHRDASAADILANIREATESFTQGAPANDDRTIIIIKRT